MTARRFCFLTHTPDVLTPSGEAGTFSTRPKECASYAASKSPSRPISHPPAGPGLPHNAAAKFPFVLHNAAGQTQRETRCALPFTAGLSLTVARLRSDRGDRFFRFFVRSLPALSPSQAGPLRTDNSFELSIPLEVYRTFDAGSDTL